MGSCCSNKPPRVISVGNTQAGIKGLDEILHQVKEEGLVEKEALERELLALARDHGNYIASSMEGEYAKALLREYKEYCQKLEPHTR